MSSDVSQQNKEETSPDKNTTTKPHGDQFEDEVEVTESDNVSILPMLSTLVNGYISGISSSMRASLYFCLIMYISIFYSDLQSTSYLADAKSFPNQYFVKFAWGWTFSAVFLFMLVSNYITTGSWFSDKTLKSSGRLVVGTIVWYVFARIIFPYIEEVTGVCEVSSLVTKRSCYMAGHFWRGFDISGHCFLLSWNNLFMVEESQGFFQNKKSMKVAANRETQEGQKESFKHYLEYLSFGLAFLILLGEVMILCTSLYFHTFMEKLFGTLCGLGSWYLMYKKLYQGSWHPLYLDPGKKN